jgi:transposase
MSEKWLKNNLSRCLKKLDHYMERADRDGVPKAAQDLGLAESMLYSWRSKRRQIGQPFEEQKLQQAELMRLKRENARLEEEVAFLKKAAAYFAKLPK